MEPKRPSPQPQAYVEPKKRFSPSRGGGGGAAAGGADSSLSSLFHPPSHGAGKEDLYSIFYKGQNGPAQAGTADGKSQWTPAKTRSAKDSKHPNPNDSVDTSCFGSSVHYGGREYFYGSSTTPKQATESNEYKADNKDPATDSHGDWWQGSFYY